MKHLMMGRKLTLLLLITVLFTVPLFAEFSPAGSIIEMEFMHVNYIGVVTEESDYEIPHNILNNEFYLESLRLTKLAYDTYEYGDYDASTGFAEEAIVFAQRSDEFVSTQLINEARRLLNWADANNIANRFPQEYKDSKQYYEDSVIAHEDENWDDSIALAISSIQIMTRIELGGIEEEAPAPAVVTADDSLPSTYTVRPWATSRDCLWNIAGYSQIYGDPWKWRVLYEANKSKMPDPNNPDLIHPGMVLDIPR